MSISFLNIWLLTNPVRNTLERALLSHGLLIMFTSMCTHMLDFGLVRLHSMWISSQVNHHALDLWVFKVPLVIEQAYGSMTWDSWDRVFLCSHVLTTTYTSTRKQLFLPSCLHWGKQYCHCAKPSQESDIYNIQTQAAIVVHRLCTHILWNDETASSVRNTIQLIQSLQSLM